MIIPELMKILEYYKDTYQVEQPIEVIYEELITNNVVVKGNSFYCPIWNDELDGWLLLAGTTTSADMWVMKKIIRLIKSGDKVYSMLNGNAEYLLGVLDRYGVEVISRDGDMCYISFNVK